MMWEKNTKEKYEWDEWGVLTGKKNVGDLLVPITEP